MSADDKLRDLYEAMGLGEGAVEAAVQGRHGRPDDGFDALVHDFRKLGLTESQAKAAATGRDGSERRARARFSGAVVETGSAFEPGRFRAMQELVERSSDAELAEVVEADPVLRQRMVQESERRGRGR